jgi:hypothetical protein
MIFFDEDPLEGVPAAFVARNGGARQRRVSLSFGRGGGAY